MTDEAKALVDAVDRYVRVCTTGSSDGAKYRARKNLMDHIEALEAEIERLREALREVFEEWAGSEGFIPETAPEGYLLQLTKRMADIARAALAGDSNG